MVKRAIDKFDLVIASRDLGGLAANLKRISQSSVLPKRVIWCLPPNILKYSEKVNTCRYPFSVSIFESPKSGQVHQRVLGISQATSEFVIFMDDDIEFGCRLFEKLMEHVVMFNPCVVSPLIFNFNQTPLYKKPTKITKVIDFLIHGFSLKSLRSGRIGLSGFPKYVHLDDFKSSSFEVEWLPGGVQAVKRSLFPKQNYYPYEGKAYCEDLFLSEIYKKKCIKMLVLPEKVYTEVSPLQSSYKSLYFDFKARLSYVIYTKKSVIRMTLWYICLVLGSVLLR
jgi:glycosyltransferase involved in cell wall biosynthesis